MPDDQFEKFMEAWEATRISGVGDWTDPSDREYIVKKRVAELSEIAREKGWISALSAAAAPHGGVVGYVRHLFDSADRRLDLKD